MGSARSRRYLFQSQPDLEERIATCSSHYPHRHRHSTGETGGHLGAWAGIETRTGGAQRHPQRVPCTSACNNGPERPGLPGQPMPEYSVLESLLLD